MDFFKNPTLRFTPPNQLDDPYGGIAAFTSFCTPIEFFRDYDAIVDKLVRIFSLTHPDAWKLRELPQKNVCEFLQEEERQLIEVNRDLHARYGYGVLCLSSDSFHELLWARYAEQHKGFAIGIRREASIFDAARWEERHMRFVIRKVEYLMERSDVSFWAAARDVNVYLRCLFQKSYLWEHESEIRAVLSNAYDMRGQIAGVVPVDITDIAEIILGADVDPDVEAAARTFCKNNKVPLKRIRLHPTRWVLTQEKVNLKNQLSYSNRAMILQ